MSVGEGFLIGVRWLHAVSAVIWVGGSVFYLLVLRPAARRYGPGWDTVNQAVAREFKGLVDTCILVLIATGVVMTFDRLSGGSIGVPYVIVLAIKISLALWMFYLALSKRRAVSEATPSSRQDTSASKPTPTWRRVAGAISGYNLIVILGILVFLMADLLRFLVEKTLSGN